MIQHRLAWLASLGLAACLMFTTAAAARQCPAAPFGEKRVALIIGNGAYPGSGLDTPSNDAAQLEAVLCSYGFQTQQAFTNQTRKQMIALLADLSTAAADADQVVVYFSGHGAEFDAQSQFLGIDWTDHGAGQANAISITDIKAALANSKAKAKIVILDACRTRLPGGWSQDKVQGKINYPFNAELRLMLVYATQSQYTASSGKDGMSLYTAALVNRLKQPNWPWLRLFNQVAEDVSPDGKQQRAITVGLIDDRLAPSPMAEQTQFNAADIARPPPANSATTAVLATDSRSLYVYWRYPGSVPAGADPAEQKFLEALRLQQSNPALTRAEVAANLEQSLKLLREAADLGDAEAQTNLAYHLASGKGAPLDPDAARALWERASVTSAAAANNIGVMLRGQDDRTPDIFCGQAPTPSSRASFAREAEAVTWFRKAHEMGLPSATTDLAFMRLVGWGIEQNCVEARELLEQAAARRDPSGVTWLAASLERGWGGPKDLPRAKSLYLYGIELGDPAAAVWRASFYQRAGSDVTRDEATRLMERAVATESPEAQMEYATWIERFDAPNIGRALVLYRQASQGGVRAARPRLKQLESIGVAEKLLVQR